MGVIVGGAFKAIADSLTADIIMPIIGIFVSENSFADLKASPWGPSSYMEISFRLCSISSWPCRILSGQGYQPPHPPKKEEAPPPPAPAEPSEEKLLWKSTTC